MSHNGLIIQGMTRKGKIVDKTGQRFGRLTAVSHTMEFRVVKGVTKTNALWLCRCDCGKEVKISSVKLHPGGTESCGCLREEMYGNNIADMAGRKFGRLTVRKHVDKDISRRYLWECICDCGKTITVLGQSLRQGGTKSCGCLRQEVSASNGRRAATHGESSADSSEYRSWSHMLGRCYTRTNPDYKDYGGRGITVSLEWRHSYETFLADMGRRPSITYTLERLDNSKAYSKDNCVWAPKDVQAQNRRSTILNKEKADEIRAKAASGLRRKTLAQEYAVSESTIDKIVNKETWK